MAMKSSPSVKQWQKDARSYVWQPFTKDVANNLSRTTPSIELKRAETANSKVGGMMFKWLTRFKRY